ncbi:hypothetical protein ACFL9T_00580 [Thermodesulfobacteriota bacterium]
MLHVFKKIRISRPCACLHREDGYILIVVTLMGLILAIILGTIMPQLHTSQMTRAQRDLNEYRAYEAARKGINAVRLGIQDLHNFQDVIGYAISGATTSNTFAIQGNYAGLFNSGVSIQIYFSTANDGIYTVTGATNFVTGATTEITVLESFPDNATEGYICRNRGIFWSLDQVSGITSMPKHDEYRDEEGNIQFVSGCSIELTGNEDGHLAIMVFVSRDNQINDVADGDPRNDGWYFYSTKSGVTGWVSSDNWPSVLPSIDWFLYPSTGVSPYYYDFDMKEELDVNNYSTNTDIKYELTGVTWYFSVGHNGSWRNEDGGVQLWNVMRDFSSGVSSPFQGKDNDADGDSDSDDNVEVFIFVRSTGITAAPDTNYASDKNSLKLVNDVNSRMPNPMRQVLEAGFFLEDE